MYEDTEYSLIILAPSVVKNKDKPRNEKIG